MKPGKALMICYAVVSMSLNSQAQNAPITLKQVVDAAIARNFDVKNKEFDMDVSHIDWKQGKANLLPSFSANINHNFNQGRSIDPTTNSYVNSNYSSASYNLGGDVTLFSGLRWMNNMKATRYAYDASRSALQQQKDDITLNVILAYLDMLSNYDLLEQAKKQVEVTQKQVDRLTVMNEEGAIKPSDLYDVKGTLADNKIGLTNARNNLATSRLKLAQLMNVPYDEHLEIERIGIEQFATDYTATTDSIYAAALEHMGLVKQADLLVKSLQKSLKASRGALWPTLSFGGGIDTRFASTPDATGNKVPYYDQLSNNYFTNYGFGLRIPILNSLVAKHNVERSKVAVERGQFNQQATLTTLKQNIERDRLNLENTRNRYLALVEQVSAYTENFRAAEIRFNNGASNSVDYLLAKNNLDRSNTNLIIARYEYVLRTKILDYYQGKFVY
ncbi:TolC family protein [Paraflavitalea pollutisoli]|uniref:TolC family protein n=1 Tax=Paraflavitalea pollutisoli TaxID=3034143 RepID=UPI0023EB4308|nr:TolC family protein [Paraflavitalea sp. H1-2-19X]